MSDDLNKAAFFRGADFAAMYHGDPVPFHLIEEAFSAWEAEQTEDGGMIDAGGDCEITALT